MAHYIKDWNGKKAYIRKAVAEGSLSHGTMRIAGRTWELWHVVSTGRYYAVGVK